jgi:hypothetical protein
MDANELKILDNLADCWNLFCKLEVQHPDDARDFADAIHDCQRIVMSRECVRQYPETFPIRHKEKSCAG